MRHGVPHISMIWQLLGATASVLSTQRPAVFRYAPENSRSECMDGLSDWFTYNRFNMNRRKTKNIIFWLRTHDTMHNSERVQFLEVTLDHRLKFEKHDDIIPYHVLVHSVWVYGLLTLEKTLCKIIRSATYFHEIYIIWPYDHFILYLKNYLSDVQILKLKKMMQT